LNEVVRILNQPFLGSNPKMPQKVYKYLGIALFVAIFLWFFEPFGIHQYKGNKAILAGAFGLVTLSMSTVYHLLSYYLVGIRQDHPSWKFWKWILFTMGLILCIAIGNFLLVNAIYDWSGLTTTIFMRFVVYTLAIGIFPVAISGWSSMLRNTRKFIHTADSTTKALNNRQKQHAPVTKKDVVAINNIGKAAIDLPAHSVCYLQAMENYVAIHHFNTDGKVDRLLIRHTLQAMLENLPSNIFLRCHRSFIVNLGKVTRVDGNAQGLMLRLDGLPDHEYVPVSRKYIPLIRKALA